MKTHILIPALIALFFTSCAENWTFRERKIICGESDTLHVCSVDNPKEEKILRSRAKAITPRMLQSDEYSMLAAKMLATVTAPSQDGVGIAGPQVGILRRIIAVQRFDKPGEPFEVYPDISITAYHGDPVPGPEGCLSVPDLRGEVRRWQDIEIHYYDPVTLKDTTERVTGFTAVIFQHECDHLYGIIYTDRIKRQQAETE